MTQKPLRAFILISLMSFIPVSGHAAGLFVGEVGTHALSRGGALIVNPNAPSAAFLNPAALAFLKGTQLQFHLNYVSLNTEFTRSCGSSETACGAIDVKRDYGDHGYAKTSSGRNPVDENADLPSYAPTQTNIGKTNTPSSFDEPKHSVSNQAPGKIIPTLFVSYSGASFNMPNLTLALSFAAPNASGADYGADEYTRFSLVKKELIGGYYGMSAGYLVTSWLALGGSIQGQTMGSHQSVAISADPLGIENPDYDVIADVDVIKHSIPTGNVGLWLSPYQGIEVGFSYQHGATAELSGPVKLRFGPELIALSDTLSLVPAGDGSPMAYATMSQPGIARGGVLFNTAKLFNMPLDVDLEFDGVYEMWSANTHVPMRIEGIAMQVGAGEPALFEPIVMPKDWQDTYSIRMGTEWRLLQKTLALRAGGFYESSAIPNETLTVENIDANKYGAGLGVAYRFGNYNLELGYQGVLLDERTIDDESIIHNTNVMVKPLAVHDNGATRVAMGTYNAQYHIVSFGITGVFGAGTTQSATELKTLSPKVGTGFDDVTMEEE